MGGITVLGAINKKVAQSVGDIIVQLDVFDEQRECDEAQSLQGPNGINLSSHLDVFYAILRQVADTPQEVPFLSILQHLLRIDPKEPVSDIIWDTAEKLVHRATLLENHEDSVRLLRTSSGQKFTCPNCRSDATSPSRKPSGVPISLQSASTTTLTPQNNNNNGHMQSVSSGVSKPPPPPPPAPPIPPHLASKGVPPPPPPPINGTAILLSAGAPPIPPPPAPTNLLAPNSSTTPSRPLTPEPRLNDILLPQQDTPAPKTKMKTLNWGKIPPNKVLGKQNIWTIVASNHQGSSMTDMDWSEMEGLFCIQSTSAQCSPKLGRADGFTGGGGGSVSTGHDTLDRKSKKENTEITLLDGKRSLNVNIYLKQFKGYNSNDEIIQLIHNGDHEAIGAEKLKGLLKILPEVDELDMLKSFNDLMNNKHLQEVLYMVVVAGNFLNSGGYAGNAAGVKLISLQKLTDIRANKPGMNLIHFVAMQAEKHEDIKEQMTEFLQSAERELSVLKSGMRDVEAMRLKLADFFCEDPATFKLEECLKIFHIFCDKFKQAIKENERRQQQEEQASLRRKQREEQLARKTKYANQCSTPVSDNETNQYNADTMFDPKASPAFSRKRMSSFNNGSDVSNNYVRIDTSNGGGSEGISPDITPNGSMRRRRSRVLTEEDDLMEFLRSSGHDHQGRERKVAYGSLDRSWARRARSGSSSRKRPDLLNVDFGSDREQSERKLDTLPEEKCIPTTPNPYTNDSNQIKTNKNAKSNIYADALSPSSENYKRAYPDWKPSAALDTDVVGTLQAIADVNNARKKLKSKEKTLGTEVEVPDSAISLRIDDIQNYQKPNDLLVCRKQKSTENNSALESIAEEDRRKTLIQQLGEREASDRLHSYATEKEITPTKSHVSVLSTPSLGDSLKPAIKPTVNTKVHMESEVKSRTDINAHCLDNSSKIQSHNEVTQTYNRQEIDADNIETPPAERKFLSSPPTAVVMVNGRVENLATTIANQKHVETEPTCNESQLDSNAPGHFDRYSLARRTRRFKRPTDYSSGNEELSSNKISIENKSSSQPSSTTEIRKAHAKVVEKPVSLASNNQNAEVIPKRPALNSKTITKLEKVGRHISSINQKDVQEAIRNLKSPTDIPERLWSPSRNVVKNKTNLPAGHIPTTTISNGSAVIKISNHELNDEGFEETQSLVSDTPSHGKESTNSSCNEVNETTNELHKTIAQRTTAPIQKISSKLADRLQLSKLRNASAARPSLASTQSTPRKIVVSVDKTRNARVANGQLVTGSGTYTNNAQRRTNGPISTNIRNVERSGSRNSLRSSRSSINSAASTQTVKRMPVMLNNKAPLQTVSVESSPSKRPLAAQNTKITLNGVRIGGVPASRSSSSGSSIGHNIVVVRKASSNALQRHHPTNSNLGSTSFKENQTNVGSSRPQAARSTILVKTTLTNPPAMSSMQRNNSRNNSSTSRGISSFMRPTAASTTKRQK
uniref:FH2 domain-containing protein n=1 Tax=Glossina brevipalpis TaxID=37001 RepID=A0A1A9WG34_9MUSC